jgi:hypothetical protein
MPVPNLISASTQDSYVDSLTVIFPLPKPGFSVQIFNAGIVYQLAMPGASGNSNDYNWNTLEQTSAPALLSFNTPESEGLPEGNKFVGIRVKSALAGTPAVVSVA